MFRLIAASNSFRGATAVVRSKTTLTITTATCSPCSVAVAVRAWSASVVTPKDGKNEGDSSSADGVFHKIACIGSGMIAQAMIIPMIKDKVQPAQKFMIYDVNVSTMHELQEQQNVRTASSIRECVQNADLVLCAVKPQNLTAAFFEELAKGAEPNSILLSVVAGKPMHVYTRGGFAKIVRSMPNTPATIGQGMTVWSATENLTVEEREKIRKVLSSCGKSVRFLVFRFE